MRKATKRFSALVFVFAIFVIALCNVCDATGSSCMQTQSSLFERIEHNPFIPRKAHSWREVSTANVGVIERGDQMLMFYRGTQHIDGRDIDQIGRMLQSVEGFSPLGAWTEPVEAPVIAHGTPESYDYAGVLDSSPVLAPDGTIYLYYSAVNRHRNYALAGARSTDGGATFEKFATNPLKMHVGIGDAVYHDGEYYLFYLDAKWDEDAGRLLDRMRVYVVRSKDPERFDFSQAQVALSPSETDWDMFAVGGARVFRLDDRWYMIYQGSDVHLDFPARFHCAVSDDLLVWHKVVSDRPLFERGLSGTWDQGAIWHGEVVEHEGMLYLFYEAWGQEGPTPLRNQPYFAGGCSQIGAATCSKEAFLGWVAGK